MRITFALEMYQNKKGVILSTFEEGFKITCPGEMYRIFQEGIKFTSFWSFGPCRIKRACLYELGSAKSMDTRGPLAKGVEASLSEWQRFLKKSVLLKMETSESKGNSLRILRLVNVESMTSTVDE
jgi:hypothetical protein